MSKTAIIVGAGIGGLATAIRLARDGWKVKVLEKKVRVGGKLDGYGEQGFLWDIGPSIVRMPFVLRELFEYAGHDIEDYIELLPLDPACRYFFPDGKTINTWSNFHHFQIEVARREKDHGEALEAFNRYTRSLWDFFSDVHLFPSESRLGSIRYLKHLHRLFNVLSPRRLAGVVESYFKDPHLRQVFQHYAMEKGMSPYRASSFLNLISHTEMQNGGWYIRGGMYRLAEALEKCARDLNVEILMDAEVSEISLEEGGSFQKPKAKGVVIRGGIQMDADVVICNADLMHVWGRLLHTKAQPTVFKKLNRKPLSSAPFILLLGVKHRFEKLAHRNVFFSSDYLAEADDIFQKKRPPTEPTIEVSISARTDATQAPAGQDNYVVLTHVPALEPDHHWENTRDSYRNLIIEQLEKSGLAGLQKEIVYEKIITPADFSSRTNAYRGACYGHVMNSFQDVMHRSENRSSEIDRLYFVGGSTQPGGGIPFVFLSAQRVARDLDLDL